MIIGIIDLGSNTFNLLITETNSNGTTTLFNDKIPVKLFVGRAHKNIIHQEAITRGLAALKIHQETLIKFNVDKVFAFATSAIRSSDNGSEFVKLAKLTTGIEIEVISGDKEAELIFCGVKQAIILPKDNVLIIDIGGGSTEFIIANNEKLLWKQSFPLGVSRLKEKFNPSDPITLEEQNELLTFLNQELISLFEALEKYPANILVGSSGSFDSFAEMIAHRTNNFDVLINVNSYQFNIKELIDLNHFVLFSTYNQRLKIPGLIEMRADMIVIAGVFIEFIINKIQAKEVYLSKFALKEGALHTIINN